MVLQMSLLSIDKASLFKTFDSLKIKNFRYTRSCLELLRTSMSSLSLFELYYNFSCFGKSLTVTFPYLLPISMDMFSILLGTTKLKIIWKKAKNLQNAFQSYYDLFQVN